MIIVLKGSASSGWFAPPKGTHTGEQHRKVGSGRPVLAGGTEVVFRGGITEGDKELVTQQLKSAGIGPASLKGIEITTDPPEGYEQVEAGQWFGGRGRILGLYRPMTADVSVIHVHPEVLRAGVGATLIHEVGHGVWHRFQQVNPKEAKKVDRELTRIIKRYNKNVRGTRLEGKARSELRRAGLRKYSLSSSDELMSDSFKVLRSGDTTMRANLVTWFKRRFIDVTPTEDSYEIRAR